MTTPSALVATDRGVRESLSRDASGLELVPESVARPRSEAEVLELLREAARDGTAVTAAGGQTSTTAASITDRGLLLSLRQLDAVGDVDEQTLTVRVQAGALLGDLKRSLAARGLLFAPDPTSEDDVTVGGAIACNASGARSLRYGPTRPHVAGLRVALASGEVIDVRRTRLEKNTVGYALVHDPVDWFVGSEGTLGVILEAELTLLPLPASVIGLGIPFASEREALAFVVVARRAHGVAPQCLEYFDSRALDIARVAEGSGSWAAGAEALVYVEEASRRFVRDDLPRPRAGDDDASTTITPPAGDDPPLEAWVALAERFGARADDMLVFDGEGALREARRIRHAIPATMNERGAQCRRAGGRKVSTDWAVPYAALAGAVAVAREHADAAGIEQAVIYGHAGNGHPHQNFIARDAGELARIERVVADTLAHVVSLGGTVAAEHGIGKIKRRWLPLQLSPQQLAVMQGVKGSLDPDRRLAPGNLFA